MRDHIMGNNFSISVKDTNFVVSSGNISLKFSFHPEFGFVIQSFQNVTDQRTVEYIQSEQPFSPFKILDEKVDDDSPEFDDDLINIVLPEELNLNYVRTGAPWNFEKAEINEIFYGGVKTYQLSASVYNQSCRYTLHVIVFPPCSIIRYYFEIENLTDEITDYLIHPFKLRLYNDSPRDIWRGRWFKGAHAAYDYGKMFERTFGASYNKKVKFGSYMTIKYVPLMVLTRDQAPEDGVVIQMDYTSRWSAIINRIDMEMCCDFMIEDEAGKVSIAPGNKVQMPFITLAGFYGSLDNMMVQLYDWQYKYMWDYTNSAYFAKTRSEVAEYPWVYCSRILHEQFAYRLVGMDFLGIKRLTECGQDMSWDDAGWSAFPGWPDDEYASVFKNNYEGPDHRLSTRFFKKNGIGRLIWFAGKPSLGLLNTKHGAWGTFEWRTDALFNNSLEEDLAFKKMLAEYLEEDVHRSFHTCCGGACYALIFDIQRLANYHYGADGGCGPCNNYYYSYFILPDKWGELPPASGGGERYAKDGSFTYLTDIKEKFYYAEDHARNRLSMVPTIAPNVAKNTALIREDLEIYRYFLEKGLAGKWSYMFHPGVYGDDPLYYMQRTSKDRMRACIIIRRRPTKRVRVYPAGLLEQERYLVSFAMTDESYYKTGKELMDDGLVLENVPARQLIYLNLPDAPGKVSEVDTPQIPKVYKIFENNVGVSGIGIYWCADSDQIPVRHYEIARNGEVIGIVAKARYYFDYEADWDINAVYTVRGISMNNTPGSWTEADKLDSDVALSYSSLGNHGENFGKMDGVRKFQRI